MAKIETGAANVVRVIYPVQENPKLTDTVVIGDPETGIINCTTLGHTKQLYAGTIAREDTGFVTGHDVAEALGSKADSSAVNALLDAKVDKVAGAGLMTDEERAKLAAIEAGANAYTLPVATAETLGGIKVGDNLTINAEGVLSAISEASGVGETYSGSVGGEIFNSYADAGSYYKRNVASGSYSHAEGNNTQASGGCAHAEGDSTQASGGFAHAEGDTAKALGEASHAEGRNTTAADLCAHAEGIIRLPKVNIPMQKGVEVKPTALPLMLRDREVNLLVPIPMQKAIIQMRSVIILMRKGRALRRKVMFPMRKAVVPARKE